MSAGPWKIYDYARDRLKFEAYWDPAFQTFDGLRYRFGVDWGRGASYEGSFHFDVVTGDIVHDWWKHIPESKEQRMSAGRLKGYALIDSESGLYLYTDVEHPKYGYLRSALADATLFATPRDALTRAFDLGYWCGARYGDLIDRSNSTSKTHRTPQYVIVRVIETEESPAVAEGWYITRAQLADRLPMWLRHGEWFTTQKDRATRFSGIGHAINALNDWKAAVFGIVSLGNTSLSIVHEDAVPAKVRLTTEVLA